MKRWIVSKMYDQYFCCASEVDVFGTVTYGLGVEGSSYRDLNGDVAYC